MFGRLILFCLLSLSWASAIAADPLRVLAFGDSNTWGWIPNGGGSRYDDQERWAGVAAKELSDDVEIICDGLVARRTNMDGLKAGPVDGSFLNGAKTLPAAIARNAPLDLVILFLGTNDIQAGAERTAEEVALAAGELVELARSSEKLLYASYPAPDVWVIVPPALEDLSASPLEGLFSVGFAESQRFSETFAALSDSRTVMLIDSAKILEGGIGPDGIHLNKTGHQQLGKAVSSLIRQKFGR